MFVRVCIHVCIHVAFEVKLLRCRFQTSSTGLLRRPVSAGVQFSLVDSGADKIRYRQLRIGSSPATKRQERKLSMDVVHVNVFLGAYQQTAHM